MKVVFKKKFELWLMKNPYYIFFAFLAPLLFIYVKLDSSGIFTRKYGNPEIWMYILSICLLFSTISLTIWAFTKPKEIVIDFGSNKVSTPSRTLYFEDKDKLLFKSKSYKNLYWYEVKITKNHITIFKTPDGYEANIEYPALLNYLASTSKPFKLSHSNSFFNENQSERDKILAERGKSILKKD